VVPSARHRLLAPWATELLSVNAAFFFIISAGCFNPLLGRTGSRAGVEQPFDCLVIQNRQAMQSMRRSMD